MRCTQNDEGDDEPDAIEQNVHRPLACNEAHAAFQRQLASLAQKYA